MSSKTYTVSLTNLRIAWTCPKCHYRNHMKPCQYDFDVDLEYNENLGDCSCSGGAYADGITFDDKCKRCESHIFIEIPTYKGKTTV